MLVKITPNCVVSFEVRTTISYNSRLISVNFSSAISDHLFNSIGINNTINTNDIKTIIEDKKLKRVMPTYYDSNNVTVNNSIRSAVALNRYKKQTNY